MTSRLDLLKERNNTEINREEEKLSCISQSLLNYLGKYLTAVF